MKWHNLIQLSAKDSVVFFFFSFWHFVTCPSPNTRVFFLSGRLTDELSLMWVIMAPLVSEILKKKKKKKEEENIISTVLLSLSSHTGVVRFNGESSVNQTDARGTVKSVRRMKMQKAHHLSCIAARHGPARNALAVWKGCLNDNKTPHSMPSCATCQTGINSSLMLFLWWFSVIQVSSVSQCLSSRQPDLKNLYESYYLSTNL